MKIKRDRGEKTTRQQIILKLNCLHKQKFRKLLLITHISIHKQIGGQRRTGIHPQTYIVPGLSPHQSPLRYSDAQMLRCSDDVQDD